MTDEHKQALIELREWCRKYEANIYSDHLGSVTIKMSNEFYFFPWIDSAMKKVMERITTKLDPEPTK